LKDRQTQIYGAGGKSAVSSEYDVIVIGAGPGGYVAAIRAAQLGKKAAVVEKDEVGGVCLNRGCIPSKSLISASHRYQEALQGAEMGIETAETRVNFAKVQSWKQGIVKKLTGGVQSLFKGYGVDLIRGTAQFAGPHEIRVVEGGQSAVYRFKHCILASGSRPIELKPFPYQGRILSSTEALELAEIPQSIAVIGGGYIGIELGQTFAKFGAKVTVIEGTEQILPRLKRKSSAGCRDG
jgi:dihydrolipoamide dehydrogenase